MIKNILAATAEDPPATFAPIAAQANTRAARCWVSPSTFRNALALPLRNLEEAGLKVPAALIVLLFGAAAAAVVVFIEENGGEVVGPPASPGA